MQELKQCVICQKEFIKLNNRHNVCSRECHLQRRRNWHKANAEKIRAKQREDYYNGRKAYYAKYEKTVTGFLMRAYRNMQSRITGVQKHKHHLYQGKSLLSREDFYKFANESKEFSQLYNTWKEQGYPRKLTPSVDRIDSKLGYEIGNMEWVTHSENSRRGSLHAHELRRIKKQVMI
jgi:hypothetical protein